MTFKSRKSYVSERPVAPVPLLICDSGKLIEDTKVYAFQN